MSWFDQTKGDAQSQKSGEPGPLPLPTVDQSLCQTPGGEDAVGSVVLAGGCFWCVEAVYQALDGVGRVESGYSGGQANTADYRSVCSGDTGHAEAVRITYDRTRITLGRILQVFFGIAHDPTQHNRQGPDHGPQYRSAFFYADQEQLRIAQAYIEQLTEARVFDSPIATTLEPLEALYQAETYHQNFVRNNPDQPYARMHAMPKVAKLREQFAGQ